MYAHLTGTVAALDEATGACVLDVNGIGFEVMVARTTLARLAEGQRVTLCIVECSGGLYGGGGPVLYGFLSRQEKEIFLAFKENLSNVGPKKALEYLDKVSANIGDFWGAVASRNLKALMSLFGFRSASAEKILASLGSLKSLPAAPPVSAERLASVGAAEDLVSALVSLGYSEQRARVVAEQVMRERGGDAPPDAGEMPVLLKKAVQLMAASER